MTETRRPVALALQGKTLTQLQAVYDHMEPLVGQQVDPQMKDLCAGFLDEIAYAITRLTLDELGVRPEAVDATTGEER